MNDIISIDQFLNRAFQLAYFIHRDRNTAIEIAFTAMDKLELASAAQDKRLYYKPVGRSSSPAARTKVSWSRLHLLQRLVYIESESYERAREQAGPVAQSDLIVHFIKQLVRVSLKRNSFYVTLCISRLLHNYTTVETAEIYNLIVQDPERIRDDYYYRSRKKRLMQELKIRFGDLIRTYHIRRGEERFQSQNRPEEYLNLVRQSLIQFTPWGTQCVLPADFDPLKSIVGKLFFRGDYPDEEHAVEVNRIHTVLHPDCYGRLVAALGFDTPARRLEIPYFFISDSDHDPRSEHYEPPDLNEDEIASLKHRLDDQAARRRKYSGGLLAVLVDGVEQARLDVRRAEGIHLSLEEGAELIEFREMSGGGAVVAAHFLGYDESGIQPSQVAIVMENGQKLSLAVSAASGSDTAAPLAMVHIQYGEAGAAHPSLLERLRTRVGEAATALSGIKVNLGRPARAILFLSACAAGLLFYLYAGRGTQERSATSGSQETTTGNQAENQVAQQTSPPLPPAGRTQPLDSATDSRSRGKGAGQVREPDAGSRLPSVANNNRTPPPPPEDLGIPGESTRAPVSGPPAASLLTVRKIYIDLSGNAPLDQEVREALMRAMLSSGRFNVASGIPEADAALKSSVTAKGGGQVTVTVRLVNAEGQAIWPGALRNAGKTYSGDATAIASRLVRDLLTDLKRLERQQ